MAVIGRWLGGSKSQGNLPETWTAPVSLFDNEDRNDGLVYSFAGLTSILTLPSSNLAGGYLIVGAYEYEDTSNGRFNPQGRIIQASGTGSFVGGTTGGYNRDNSEDRSYVRSWAFIANPSASATFQFQWKGDTDDAAGGTVRSSFEVIPIPYSDIGMYTSTDAGLLGGTTRNVIGSWSTVLEGINVTRSSNIVSVTGDNKNYIVLNSQFFEGRGGRTQRWHGIDVDGAEEHAAKAYSFYRNTSNDESGELFSWLLRTVTSTITIEQTCYRGIGISNGQGGANIDGNTPGVGSHALVVIELNDSAQVFRNTGSTNQNIATPGPVDVQACKVGDIDFNDSASFLRASDIGMNAEVAMDALIGANICAASETVTSNSRYTSYGQITVNGVEDTNSFAGDYLRGNQGNQDTFGWSANLLSFVALAQDEDVGASITELSGSEGGGGAVHIQPGWAGFWGVNLDTLEVAVNPDIAAILNVAVTSASAIKGIGSVQAAPAIAITQASFLKGRTSIGSAMAINVTTASRVQGLANMATTLGIAFSQGSAIKGIGSVQAAPVIAITQASLLKGSTSLAAALTIELNTLSRLQATVDLAAALNISISLAAILEGVANGDIAAALNIAITHNTILKGSTSLAAAPTISLSQVSTLRGTGNIQAALDIAINALAHVQATIDIAAVLNVAVTSSAQIKGLGAVRSALTVALTQASILKATGNITASNTIALQIASMLKGTGNIDAALNIAIDVAASIVGLADADIAASLVISINQASVLKGTGNISAALNAAISLIANIEAGVGPNIAAALSIAITTNPTIKGIGNVAATPTISMGVVGLAKGVGSVGAALNTVITTSTNVNAVGNLRAALDIAIDQSSDLQGVGNLKSSLDLVFNQITVLQGIGDIQGALQLQLFLSATLIGLVAPDEVPELELDSSIQILLEDCSDIKSELLCSSIIQTQIIDCSNIVDEIDNLSIMETEFNENSQVETEFNGCSHVNI